MTFLPDSTLDRLRHLADRPDFSGTKYEIIEKLGEGGMASVYTAYDRDLERRVAVKVVRSSAIDPAMQERMLFEARIIARLEHPGILPIHDLGILPDGRIFYVMKLVRGRSLDQYIDTSVSLADRLRLFIRICDAVAFAHSHGVIHRDLKPANILIGDFGEVLVIDWGLAKALAEDSTETGQNEKWFRAGRAGENAETLHGDILGTPGHMAPEQEHGEIQSVDRRTDVYALGVLLVSLLTAVAGPKSIRAVAEKAMSHSASDRYQTVGELGRDVGRFLDGESVTAFPEGLWETGLRLIYRHRTAIILISTYLVIRVVLLLIAT